MLGNPTAPHTARVVVIGDSAASPSLEIGRQPVVVGSAANAELVLTDPSVANLHVELALRDDGLHVRDLGSTSGTWVSSVRVKDVVLTHSAVLAVGKTMLSIEVVWPGELEVLRSRRGKATFDMQALEATARLDFDDLTHLPYREARARALERFERSYLPGVLARTGNVVIRAAKHAGVGRGSFHRMLGRIRPNRMESELPLDAK